MNAVLEDVRAVNSPNPTSFRAPTQSISMRHGGLILKRNMCRKGDRRPYTDESSTPVDNIEYIEDEILCRGLTSRFQYLDQLNFRLNPWLPCLWHVYAPKQWPINLQCCPLHAKVGTLAPTFRTATDCGEQAFPAERKQYLCQTRGSTGLVLVFRTAAYYWTGSAHHLRKTEFIQIPK